MHLWNLNTIGCHSETAAFPYQTSMGHSTEFQLKDPLLSQCSWGCCHRGTVLIRQKKTIPFSTRPTKCSHVLLAMLRKIHYCLSLFLNYGAQWYLQIKETSEARLCSKLELTKVSNKDLKPLWTHTNVGWVAISAITVFAGSWLAIFPFVNWNYLCQWFNKLVSCKQTHQK